MNIYQDGRDSIAWHADDANGVVEGSSVASISLGAERRFYFRPYIPGVRARTEAWPEVSINLGSGSLLVMGPNTNEFWCHALKADESCLSPRVNLTFRSLLPRDALPNEEESVANSSAKLQKIHDSSGSNYERLAKKHRCLAPGQHPVYDHGAFCDFRENEARRSSDRPTSMTDFISVGNFRHFR